MNIGFNSSDVTSLHITYVCVYKYAHKEVLTILWRYPFSDIWPGESCFKSLPGQAANFSEYSPGLLYILTSVPLFLVYSLCFPVCYSILN